MKGNTFTGAPRLYVRLLNSSPYVTSYSTWSEVIGFKLQKFTHFLFIHTWQIHSDWEFDQCKQPQRYSSLELSFCWGTTMPLMLYPNTSTLVANVGCFILNACTWENRKQQQQRHNTLAIWNLCRWLWPFCFRFFFAFGFFLLTVFVMGNDACREIKASSETWKTKISDMVYTVGRTSIWYTADFAGFPTYKARRGL